MNTRENNCNQTVWLALQQTAGILSFKFKPSDIKLRIVNFKNLCTLLDCAYPTLVSYLHTLLILYSLIWTRPSIYYFSATLSSVIFPGERDTESVEDDREDVPLPFVPAVAVPSSPGFGYFPSFSGFFPDFDLFTRIRGLCYYKEVSK